MRALLIPAFTAALTGLSPTAIAQSPAAVALPSPQIAYQGRLLEATLPVTGMRNFTFQILDGTSTELWNSGTVALAVNSGLYAVALGASSMTAIPLSVLDTPNLRLRVAVEGRLLSPDVDLVPALQARSAFELSGAFGGDLGGTQYSTTLNSLQGIPLDLTTSAPVGGQSLVFNGSQWVPAVVTGLPGPQGPAGATGPQGPAGLGSVVSITAGSGLTGGTITTSGTISIAAPYITVQAGAGLSGGGQVSLGGNVTLADTRFGTNTGLAASGSGGDGKCLGEVWLVAGNVASGMPCDGRLLSTANYSPLFALLGNTYGGDGISTFAVPDLRGVAPNKLTYVICVEGSFPIRD